MTKETKPDEIFEIVKGLFLLLLCHVLAGVIIFFGGLIIQISPIGAIYGPYTMILFWLSGAVGFLVWQLLYVILLTIWLKRKHKDGMRKGVIIGAALTALVNLTALGISIFYRY
jgi:Na+/proline symporter